MPCPHWQQEEAPLDHSTLYTPGDADQESPGDGASAQQCAVNVIYLFNPMCMLLC